MDRIAKLKLEALDLADDLRNVNWFKRIGIRSRLKDTLNEIEYQEGRLQYSNRPYSRPTVRIPPKQAHLEHTLYCRCGCWIAKRKELIGM